MFATSFTKYGRKIPSLLLSLAVVFAAGCASGPDIRQDKDPSADLRSYKTFAFFEPVATDRLRYSTLLSSHLKQATREQMEKHHYVYSEKNPDLRVNLFLTVVDRQDVRSMPSTGPGPYGYAWNRGVETVNYRQGTLMIDLVDTRKQALVWQGVAEGRVDQKAFKNPGPALSQVVGEIFAAYPGSAAR